MINKIPIDRNSRLWKIKAAEQQKLYEQTKARLANPDSRKIPPEVLRKLVAEVNKTRMAKPISPKITPDVLRVVRKLFNRAKKG